MALKTVLASVCFLLLLTRGPFADAGEDFKSLKGPTIYGSLFCVCVMFKEIITDYDMACRSSDSSDHTVCGE